MCLTDCSVALNCAVAEEDAFSATVQVFPEPLHAPDHPANSEPEVGFAVSVTEVPEAKLAVQAWQLIPGGLLTIVPLPEPVAVTLS